MNIPIIVLIIVFLGIAIRQIGKIKFQIWQVMLFGAIAVIITKQIALLDALKAINLDVMLFLFGMFVVGQALEKSGYLSHLAYKVFKRAKSADHVVLFILFGMGIASAFLMNDTLAIIGTPVVLLLARKQDLDAKLLLLTLAFAVTIGSVMSPIGNPQNLLIAINGNIGNPFIIFFQYLFVPTMVSLLACFFILKLFYKEKFRNGDLNHSQEPILNHQLAVLSKISLMLLIALILVKIGLVFLEIRIDFRLTYIALIAALPILLFSSKRKEIIQNIDWHTLIFFAAMFVLMESVWQTGFFQNTIAALDVNITSLLMIFSVSIVLSQFISNVPLVALYLPMLLQAGAATKEMAALAAGSTLAGNLFILGAASNVIIIQNAEKKSQETITFWEFAKVGIPLTAVTGLVYWLYLAVI